MSAAIIEYEVWESQRKSALGTWSSANLKVFLGKLVGNRVLDVGFGADPHRFSNRSNLPCVPIPQGRGHVLQKHSRSLAHAPTAKGV